MHVYNIESNHCLGLVHPCQNCDKHSHKLLQTGTNIMSIGNQLPVPLQLLLVANTVIELGVGITLTIAPKLLSGMIIDPFELKLSLLPQNLSLIADSLARQELLWLGGDAVRAFALRVGPASLFSLGISSLFMLIDNNVSKPALAGLSCYHLLASFCIPALSFNPLTLQIPATFIHPALSIGLGAYAFFYNPKHKHGLSFFEKL